MSLLTAHFSPGIHVSSTRPWCERKLLPTPLKLLAWLELILIEFLSKMFKNLTESHSLSPALLIWFYIPKWRQILRPCRAAVADNISMRVVWATLFINVTYLYNECPRMIVRDASSLFSHLTVLPPCLRRQFCIQAWERKIGCILLQIFKLGSKPNY